MNKEIETISEEQFLHNKLSFEINQELIHLMKRIIEVQQENKELHNKIDKAIEYIEKCSLGEDYYGNPVMLAKEDEGKDLLEILKGENND